LPWSTPAISRPRAAILAIVEPAGIAPGGGSGPAGRRLSLTSEHAAPGALVGAVAEGVGAVGADPLLGSNRLPRPIAAAAPR
jgi:hypothetical protein